MTMTIIMMMALMVMTITLCPSMILVTMKMMTITPSPPMTMMMVMMTIVTPSPSMIIIVHISFKCQFLLQKHHNMMDIGWLIQKEVQSPHWIILLCYVMYKKQFGNKIDVILIQNRSSKCKACTNKRRHVAIKQEFPWVSDHDSDDSSPSSSSSSSPLGCVPGDTESVSGWWQKREIRSQAPRVPSPIISLQLGTNQRHCTIHITQYVQFNQWTLHITEYTMCDSIQY